MFTSTYIFPDDCWCVFHLSSSPPHLSPIRSLCARLWFLMHWRAWCTTTHMTGSSWAAAWFWDLWAGRLMLSLSFSRLTPASIDIPVSSNRSGHTTLIPPIEPLQRDKFILLTYIFAVAPLHVCRFPIIPWRGCVRVWQWLSRCSCLFKEAQSPTIFTACCPSPYGTLSSKSELHRH